MEIYKCFESGYRYKVNRGKGGKKRKMGHLKAISCPFCKCRHNFVKVG